MFTKHNTRGSFIMGNNVLSFALSESAWVTFGGKWIGRGDSWPAGSPDLNLLDFWLWGQVKLLAPELFFFNFSTPVYKMWIIQEPFSLTQKASGEWRLKTNEESEEAINNENIVRYTKYKRLSWLGHVEWMTNERMTQDHIQMETVCNRTEGKAKSKMGRRCEEWLEEDGGGDQLETKDAGQEEMERNNWASQNSQRVVELKEEEEYRNQIR